MEQFDIGNTRSLDWIKIAIDRLKTDEGKSLAKEIMKTESTEWWFDKKNDWWINRGKK
jgi:putative hydrolase of HD superfamily